MVAGKDNVAEATAGKDNVAEATTGENEAEATRQQARTT